MGGNDSLGGVMVRKVRMTVEKAALALAGTAVAVFLTWAVEARPAMAASGAEQVGQNLGDMLQAVGGYLLLGVAGLIAIGMLATRKFTAIGGLAMMLFIVGGLVFAPGTISHIIKGTWKALGGG